MVERNYSHEEVVAMIKLHGEIMQIQGMINAYVKGGEGDECAIAVKRRRELIDEYTAGVPEDILVEVFNLTCLGDLENVLNGKK